MSFAFNVHGGSGGGVGPEGPQGEPGPKGDPGNDGADGSNGSNGLTGQTGAIGSNWVFSTQNASPSTGNCGNDSASISGTSYLYFHNVSGTNQTTFPIWNMVNSGDYIQLTAMDASFLVLFQVNGSVSQSGNVFTVPVAYITNGGTVTNGKDTAVTIQKKGAKGDTGDKGDKGDKGDTGDPGTNGTDGDSAMSVGTVAATGSSQGDAATLPNNLNNVTGADGSNGVILSESINFVAVYNVVDATSLYVYPPSGGTLVGKSSNQPITIGSNSPTIFMQVDSTASATIWMTLKGSYAS